MLRVSHSNLSKQAILAHNVAQFVQKQYVCSTVDKMQSKHSVSIFLNNTV